MGTLERITSPVNIKSVCRKKADGRNIFEGDHSAVPCLKGALTKVGEGRHSPATIMAAHPRGLLLPL